MAASAETRSALAGVERSFGVGIIERGEELAFLDPSTLIEENAGDAPGDLGSDGGATAGGDVAAGIEQGFAATCTRRLVHGGYFNDGLGLPKREDGAGDAAENNQAAEKNSETFAEFTASALAFMDAQRGKIVFRRA